MRERFAEGLDDAAAKVSIDALNRNLGLLIDLSLIVKQAHWTLRGTNFIGVHELLDKAVGNLRDLSDKMAERAVVIGGTPVGISQRVAKETELAEYPVDLAAVKEHVHELTARYKVVAASIRAAIAEVEDDEGTADLFTEASRVIDKDTWFIGSNAERN